MFQLISEWFNESVVWSIESFNLKIDAYNFRQSLKYIYIYTHILKHFKCIDPMTDLQCSSQIQHVNK